MNTLFDNLGFGPADILLPQGCDLEKWSVIACDQYTSQPEYWKEVERLVGDAPSTLRMILPEIYLGGGEDQQIASINGAMRKYLAEGIFHELPGCFVYLERRLPNGLVRKGLVGAADLEAYDYGAGACPMIRATEGTVIERIPPRMKIRRDAPLELPHVMLLIDDPGCTVIEPLSRQTAGLYKLYDFELMQGGGHVTGYAVSGEAQIPVAEALGELADADAYYNRYGVKGPVMAYAVGDGNHSLAAAKACWEELKQSLSPVEAVSHPARRALVELVNIHDEALDFEPIHRVVFGVEPNDLLSRLFTYFHDAFKGEGEGLRYEYCCREGSGAFTLPRPGVAAGVLQEFLDEYAALSGGRIDYIHGGDVARALGRENGAVAFLLPAIGKSELFGTVVKGGPLPRKTFSMGLAQEKRYYLECRRIR